MDTQKDDMRTAVTPEYDWRAVLLRKLDEVRCAEAMLARTRRKEEVGVIAIAMLSIEASTARAIDNLGGLGAAW